MLDRVLQLLKWIENESEFCPICDQELWANDKCGHSEKCELLLVKMECEED